MYIIQNWCCVLWSLTYWYYLDIKQQQASNFCQDSLNDMWPYRWVHSSSLSIIPKFIITALQDLTWVEASHPHRNWAKNIHVRLSQADDPVKRRFVLHIDLKAAFGLIPPSGFRFPLVSENKPSDVSHDTYMLTGGVLMSHFAGGVSIVECVFAKTLKTGMFRNSRNARNASPPSWPSKKRASRSSRFLLVSVSPKAYRIPSYFETSFSQMCWRHHCHDVTPHRVTRDCFALFKTISIHPCDVIRIRQLTITPHLESISIPIKPLTYVRWSFVFEVACSLIEFHCQGDSWLSHSVGLNYILSWSTLNSAEDATGAGGSTGSIG